MFPEFAAFNVEIKNLRFTADDGQKYPKTAIVTFISPDGHSEYVEVLGYLKKMSKGDKSIMVVDSRTPNWVKKGTIPGAVNIPWTQLNPDKGASPIQIGDILENRFNAKRFEDIWDYSKAKTLVMFCNGMWCGQSPNNIKNLLKFGYPAHKIKWYRGGMQNWSNLGLSVAK